MHNIQLKVELFNLNSKTNNNNNNNSYDCSNNLYTN